MWYEIFTLLFAIGTEIYTLSNLDKLYKYYQDKYAKRPIPEHTYGVHKVLIINMLYLTINITWFFIPIIAPMAVAITMTAIIKAEVKYIPENRVYFVADHVLTTLLLLFNLAGVLHVHLKY